MSLDKNILDNLSYLYSILDFLIRDCNLQISDFNTIYNHLHKENSIYNYKNNDVSYSDIIDNPLITISTTVNKDDFQKAKLIEALNYLNKEQFITINEAFTSKITFEGIIQHSKGFTLIANEVYSNSLRLAFVEDSQLSYNRHILDMNEKVVNLTRRLFWANFAIALGTLVAMVYYLLEMISTPYCFCK